MSKIIFPSWIYRNGAKSNNNKKNDALVSSNLMSHSDNWEKRKHFCYFCCCWIHCQNPVATLNHSILSDVANELNEEMHRQQQREEKNQVEKYNNNKNQTHRRKLHKWLKLLFSMVNEYGSSASLCPITISQKSKTWTKQKKSKKIEHATEQITYTQLMWWWNNSVDYLNVSVAICDNINRQIHILFSESKIKTKVKVYPVTQFRFLLLLLLI